MAQRNSGRWLLLAVAVAVAAAFVWGFWPVPPEVEAVAVRRDSISIIVREDGRTRVRERYLVSSPVAGYLLRIGLETGDRIEREVTPLAALQPTDPMLLDARARSEAIARIQAAGATVNQAKATVERATQAAELASSEYARAQELISSSSISKESFEQVEHRERMAQADVRSAEFALQVAQFEKQQAEAIFVRSGGSLTPSLAPNEPASNEPASNRGSETGESNDSQGSDASQSPQDNPLTGITQGELFTILAPVTGQVLRVLQESAGPVQVGTPLLELGDPGDLEIEVDVLSEDAVRISPGAEVTIEQWGGSGTLSGIVARVEPAAFVKVSALGVEEQRVNVIIELREAAERTRSLGDGYRIEAAIVVDRAIDALVVPSDALFRDGEEWMLFTLDDRDRLKKEPVSIGRSDGLVTEILEGLSEGTRVVSHPSDQLSAGQRVKPRT